MSNFTCEKCGAIHSDTEHGYVTGCEHYPADAGKRQNPFAEMDRYLDYVPQGAPQPSPRAPQPFCRTGKTPLRCKCAVCSGEITPTAWRTILTIDGKDVHCHEGCITRAVDRRRGVDSKTKLPPDEPPCDW